MTPNESEADDDHWCEAPENDEINKLKYKRTGNTAEVDVRRIGPIYYNHYYGQCTRASLDKVLKMWKYCQQQTPRAGFEAIRDLFEEELDTPPSPRSRLDDNDYRL